MCDMSKVSLIPGLVLEVHVHENKLCRANLASGGQLFPPHQCHTFAAKGVPFSIYTFRVLI